MMFRISLLVLAAFLVVLVLAGCAPALQMTEASPVAPTLTATRTLEPTPTITLMPTINPAQTLTLINPVPDTLYLGAVKEQDGLFVTNGGLQRYYEDGVEKTSPFIGLLAFSDHGQHLQPFHFQDLENPRQLFSVQDRVLWIENFVFDAEREELFVLLVLSDAGAWPSNSVYRVILETRDYQKVWMNEIGPGSRYGEYKGSATLDQVKGNYLVMSIAPCYACEPFPPWNTVVLNASSGTETVLGKVGNVSVDPKTNTVSYQYLAAVQAPCEPGPGCDDGYRTIYEPTGEVFVKELV